MRPFLLQRIHLNINAGRETPAASPWPPLPGASGPKQCSRRKRTHYAAPLHSAPHEATNMGPSLRGDDAAVRFDRIFASEFALTAAFRLNRGIAPHPVLLRSGRATPSLRERGLDEGKRRFLVHNAEARLVFVHARDGGGGILQCGADLVGPAFGRFSRRDATTPLTSAAAKDVPESMP